MYQFLKKSLAISVSGLCLSALAISNAQAQCPTLFDNIQKQERFSAVPEADGSRGHISYAIENEFNIKTVKGYGEIFRPKSITEADWLAKTPEQRNQISHENASNQGRNVAILSAYADLIENQGGGIGNMTEYKFKVPGVRTLEEVETWLDFEVDKGLNGSRHGWVVCNGCEKLIK